MDTVPDLRGNTWLGRPEPIKQRQFLPLIAIAAVSVVSLGVFFAGIHIGQAPIGSLETKYGREQKQVAVLSAPHRRCFTYARDVTKIEELFNRGQYQAAADLASLDLSNPDQPACAQSALANTWYTASMDALFSTVPAWPGDKTQVLVWDSIQSRADNLGLGTPPQLSPLTVAVYAYNGHDWSLCRSALAAALASGLMSGSDRVNVQLYYSATVNEGLELAQNYTGAQKLRGGRMLSTAAAIGSFLNRQEASSDGASIFGPKWRLIFRPDKSDPMLRAVLKS
jgi:hypothetical protein